MDIKIIADVRIHKPDRSGNTYHDVKLFDLKGNVIATKIMVYGYGSQYIVTICNMLTTLKEPVSADTVNWYYLNHVLALAHTY